MSKLFRTLALATLLAGATSAVTVAPAQEKGKPAKKDEDDKKADKKKAKKAGVVQINESSKNGKFYMSIRDAEGKFLAQGGPSGYENKEDALKALEAIKQALENPKIEYNAKKADDKEDDKKEMKKKEKKG